MTTSIQKAIPAGPRPLPFGYPGKFVVCETSELQPHPSYVSHGISVSSSQLAALDKLGEFAFQHPILITTGRIILDGHARWMLAKSNQRPTLCCWEYELTEQETIEWLLNLHHRLNGFVSYCRIRLALTLAPVYKQQALANQRAGGRNKAQSNLTEDQKTEVRSRIASQAHSSTGNVTKVSQILKNLTRPIDQALKVGDISIHRAWTWKNLSASEQHEKLTEFRISRGTNYRSRRMIQRHVRALLPPKAVSLRLSDFLGSVGAVARTKLESVAICEIDSPGSVAYLTKEAADILKSIGEA